MDLAKKLNVTIVQHDKHTELLHLNGTKNGVHRLIKELQKIFCVHEVKVPLPVSPLKVYEIEQSLTQIADDSNFCVEISLPRKDRTGGSLIATWFNSDARQIHVVQGNLLELKEDTILILTTEYLFPVAKLQTQENGRYYYITCTR
ncbi:hypothetical protein DPMN_165073 [Dreissena polymorpha]|uniref:Uncharacterized protein n=1 Tax=Dreissena polymorpha TaxID=45954 RepID=A0A9D4EUP7_DREPO|nr:hypothetical protein DPMN_165073 [Dreissena polymorpha]